MAFVAYVPPADSAGPFRYPARLGLPQQRPPRPTGPSLREGYVVLPLLATMTRCADLDGSPGLPRDRLVIPGALPDDLVWAAIETVPTLSHSPLSACQCLYAGGIDGCTGPDPSPSSSPSPSKGGLGSLIPCPWLLLTGPCFDASTAFAHAPARRVARLSTRPTPFGAAETFTPELSSPQVTPRRGRVSLRSCLDSCCGGTCIRWESAVMGCNFAPRALPRLIARSGPSATLSSSADFPGAPVIRPTLLRRFRGGTRRASPGCSDVSWSPCRRSHPAGGESPRQPDCDGPCCLRADKTRSASGAWRFRGYLCVHSRYGPATRRHPSRWRRRWAPGRRFPSALPSKVG